MMADFLEPEEIIENSLRENIVIEGIDIPLYGVLQACLDQIETLDTYVYVKVDQSSQDLDFAGPNVPRTYDVQIGVRMAQADSRHGKDFVLVCRQIRASINELLGDNCEKLSTDGFACDSVVLEATSTEFEGGENPINTKTYNLKIIGRTS